MPDRPEPPTRPYAKYVEEVVARLERGFADAPPLTSEHAGAPAALADALGAAVEARAGDLVDLSHDIHAHPELGYEERYAAAAAGRLLQAHGHAVEVGCYGLDTALRARAGEGRPRVAVLAEYDALPGLGHACGHNVICASAIGAFLGVAEVLGDLDGSVELIGTPAEEGGGGKEYIARAGGFDEIDAAIMLHPFGVDAAVHSWLGVRRVDVVYHGLPAHASAMPHLGRNALDAVVNAYTGIAQLRQHTLPGDRLHGIITDGGQKPSIVPERAAAAFFLRSAEISGLAELSERALDVFEAAARSTRTTVEVRWDPFPPYVPVRNNETLAARYAQALAPRGRKVVPAGVLPEGLAASTDMGNVSVRVPGIHPMLAIAPPAIAIHTAEFARWAVSERADAGTVDGAVGLALTAADYLADGALRAAVAEEFEAAGGRIDVEALLAFS